MDLVGVSAPTEDPPKADSRRRGLLLPGSAGLLLIIVGLVFVLASLTGSLGAKPPTRVPRIGFLTSSAPDSPLAVGGYQQFLQGLRDLGYVEDDNIVIDYRSSEGKPERFPDLAAELVELPVDTIVVGDGRALPAAMAATTTIPIVTPVVDMFEAGLVEKLSRPGANLTGVSTLAPDLSRKRLELLKEVAPDAHLVAVLWNPEPPGTLLYWQETEAASQQLGVQLMSLEVRTPDDLTSAFDAATRDQAEALIVLPDPLTNIHAREIADFTIRTRLPSMYGIRDFVDMGGLIYYGPSRPGRFRRIATFVDKIITGTKPTDLPVEQPTTFELVINLRTASSIGVAIPRHLYNEATDVVQ